VQLNAAYGFNQNQQKYPPNNNLYSNTYNPGWRNHPNFRWSNNNENNQNQSNSNFPNQTPQPPFNLQNFIPRPTQNNQTHQLPAPQPPLQLTGPSRDDMVDRTFAQHNTILLEIQKQLKQLLENQQK